MTTDAWIETVLKCPFCDTILLQPKPPRKIKGITVWCPKCKTADFKSAQPNPQRAARAPVHATSFPRPLAPPAHPHDTSPEALAFPQEQPNHHADPHQTNIRTQAKIADALSSLKTSMNHAQHGPDIGPAPPPGEDPGLDKIRQLAHDLRNPHHPETLLPKTTPPLPPSAHKTRLLLLEIQQKHYAADQTKEREGLTP